MEPGFDILHVMRVNLTSPAILYFVLGVLAVIVKSDLKIPPDVGRAIVIFLMAAIGLRAGEEVARMPGGVLAVVPFALAALVLGVGIVAITYFLMVKFLRIDSANSAALAASFGAVSSATMMVSISLVETLGLTYERFVPALYPFMDSPAIIMSLILAKAAAARSHAKTSAASAAEVSAGNSGSKPGAGMIMEAFTNSGVYVLLGSLVIGIIVGPDRLVREMQFFDWLFRGVLCLFLLDMGILAASRVRELKAITPLIIPFALIVATINGIISAYVASLLGLGIGGSLIFTGLAAGASYVTVPAAMRAALPEANPSLYLGVAIGIVFPYNMAIGLPLYLQFIQFLAR